MFKRLGISGAVVAVLALASGAAGPAVGSGDAGDSARHRTISVISINTEEAFVDVGKKDFSLGDAFVFHSKLVRHGHRVGHTGVVCTITSAAHEESQCVGTARFRGGQITIQGLLAGEPETFVFPVTGGSGAFEGAQGVLQVRELSGTRERLTFHLSR
jgi:hypothetical protein